MPKSNGFVLLMTIIVTIALTGCGGSSNQPLPPPGGGFSNSNLNGTYVVSFSGYDIGNGYGSFFSVLGNITANGTGDITGGTVDINDPSLGSALGTSYVFTKLSTSGTYNITADGRGTGSISLNINGATVAFGLDFVMTSTSHGLISRFDQSGSGSGSIDLQAPNLSQSSFAGSYAFGFSGVDGGAINPLATVGSFTLDSNGNVTVGQQDFGDNGDSRGLKNLSVTGTVFAGVPGSSQLTTGARGFGTLHFDVWAIDTTHLKFIETDSFGYMEGDALSSTGHATLASGPLVLTLSGEDVAQGPFAAGGMLTSDGTSQITSGAEDVNDEGLVTQAPQVTGSFTVNGARTLLTLNNIYNGNLYGNTLAAANYTFAAYPYNGGAFLLEVDNGGGTTFGISNGTLYTQSATTINSSQGYGLNLSGANGDGEVDWIAEFTTSGNTMNGLYDANNLGYLITDARLGTGTYSVASNGRGTTSFPALQTNGNSFISALNLTFYVVDSSTAVFLETDPGQLSIGAFELQTNGAGETAAQLTATARPQFSIIRPVFANHRSFQSQLDTKH